MIDLDHPFYRSATTRTVITVGCLAWAVFEFVTGAAFWGVLFGAIGLYAGYQFFVVYPKHHEETAADQSADAGEPPEPPGDGR